VAEDEGFVVATQRGGGIEREQNWPNGEQQSAANRHGYTAGQYPGGMVSRPHHTDKQNGLHQANCIRAFAKELETQGEHPGIQAAHVGLPVEEDRTLPQRDMPPHEGDDGFI